MNAKSIVVGLLGALATLPASATEPQWTLGSSLWPVDSGEVALPIDVQKVPIFGAVTEPLCVEDACSARVNGEVASIDANFSNGVVVDVADFLPFQSIVLRATSEVESTSLFSASATPCPDSIDEVRATVVPLGEENLGAVVCAYKIARVEFDRRLLETEYAIVTIGEEERTRRVIVNEEFTMVAAHDPDIASLGEAECAYTDDGDVVALNERVSISVHSMCNAESEAAYSGDVEFGLVTPQVASCSCAESPNKRGPLSGFAVAIGLGFLGWQRRRRRAS